MEGSTLSSLPTGTGYVVAPSNDQRQLLSFLTLLDTHENTNNGVLRVLGTDIKRETRKQGGKVDDKSVPSAPQHQDETSKGL